MSGMPGQKAIFSGQAEGLLITLLVQSDDEDTLRRLLDTHPYRVLAEEAGCHFFMIEDGSVTEYTTPPREPP